MKIRVITTNKHSAVYNFGNEEQKKITNLIKENPQMFVGKTDAEKVTFALEMLINNGTINLGEYILNSKDINNVHCEWVNENEKAFASILMPNKDIKKEINKVMCKAIIEEIFKAAF